MNKRRNLPARALAMGFIAAAGLAGAPSSFGASPFHAYDNSQYTGVDLVGDAGLVKSNILYQSERWVQCTRNNLLPDEAEFKQAVRDKAVNPGPIVLDFENIWVKTADPAEAKKHYLIWRQLFIWAKQAAPDRVIGAYDLLGPNTDGYRDCARDLARYQDAFYPHLYTGKDLDQPTWERRLDNRVASARNIDPQLPLLPYIRPQIESGCPTPDSTSPFLSAQRWRRQLDQLGEKASGFVVWSPVSCSHDVPVADRGWIDETIGFMQTVSPSQAKPRPLQIAPALSVCDATPGMPAPTPTPTPPTEPAPAYCDALPGPY
ncbi:hypothetical protein [Lysobacter sp. TAB13]|uniref:hypothetical protein n=1 Tax=Lysobacter sp. TAB13 TaxID=3233065 RepID=UPI003F99456F